MSKSVLAFFLFVALCFSSVIAAQSQSSARSKQSKPAPNSTAAADARPWWQNAVFYEIYMRSFADSNNDGIGDLNGITSKLDYLHELGVDAIWLSPLFPSPQVDFGYDVTRLRERRSHLRQPCRLRRSCRTAAEQRGIRVVLDLVLNHTSDQHQWFIDARSSRNSKHRDWYIWRDGKGAAAAAE